MVAAGAVLRYLGYAELADGLMGLGAALGFVGIGHKVEKARCLLLLALVPLIWLVVVPPKAVATPFLVSGTYPTTVVQPDEFVITEGATPVVSPAQKLADNSVRVYHDVQGYSAGTHNITVKARKHDPLWGVLESAAVPFAFTRPGQPTEPADIGLTK